MASPFRNADIVRVAEFFEGSRHAAYAFARDIWLREAVATLTRLRAAAESGDDLHFLCDHLREGARVVGAWRYLHIADAIVQTSSSGRADRVLAAIDEGLRHADRVSRWLDVRCRQAA